MKFFSYDQEAGDFEEHKTADAARDAAEAAIDAAAYDRDSYQESSVDGICWGQILGRCEITNRRDLTAEERAEHPECSWCGEPKLIPVVEGGDVTAKLADALLALLSTSRAPSHPELLKAWQQSVDAANEVLANAGRPA